MTSAPRSALLARWLHAAAAGARVCGSARLNRRLWVVLLAAALMVVCLLRLGRAHGDVRADAHADSSARHVSDGGVVRWLSWSSPVQPPLVAEGPAGEPVRVPAALADTVSTQVCVSFPEMLGVDPAKATRLPHIPAKIWQIYLDFHAYALSAVYLRSWLSMSPSFAYTVLDAAGALGLVGRLAGMAASASWQAPLYVGAGGNSSRAAVSDLAFARGALELYAGMPRRVLRADFLRYLVLALEGGVYSDTDTTLVKPIRDWVPEPFRSQTRLVVGLEADASPPVTGTKYEVQFCQWTLASAPDHPALWTMLDRILAKFRARQLASGIGGGGGGGGGGDGGDGNAGDAAAQWTKLNLDDADVLEITGPAAWTEVVFEHLNAVAGDGVGAAPITWQTLTGMKEPRLYGDTLVLPIDGFATGVPHSQASPNKSKQTLIMHQFLGQWRGEHG